MAFWKRRTRPQTPAPAKWGLTPASPARRTDRRDLAVILGLGALTIAAWQTPLGTTALLPFTLLATWFHEMAHGLTALMLGGGFDHLVIAGDGSGHAVTRGDFGRIDRALIAAAGFFGSTLAGAGLILASRSRRATRLALLALGGALAVSTLVWVRSLVGWIVLPLFALAALAIALRGHARVQRFAAQFLGVQAAASLYQDQDYLFSDGGPGSVSDTGAIADALFLPYWVWGGAITLILAAILWWTLRVVTRR